MPNIRPSADIRNNYPEISRQCKETGQPVYITVNGKGDAALIDIAVLDELYARIDLYEKLSVGLRDIEQGYDSPTKNKKCCYLVIKKQGNYQLS